MGSFCSLPPCYIAHSDEILVGDHEDCNVAQRSNQIGLTCANKHLAYPDDWNLADSLLFGIPKV